MHNGVKQAHRKHIGPPCHNPTPISVESQPHDASSGKRGWPRAPGSVGPDRCRCLCCGNHPAGGTITTARKTVVQTAHTSNHKSVGCSSSPFVAEPQNLQPSLAMVTGRHGVSGERGDDSTRTPPLRQPNLPASRNHKSADTITPAAQTPETSGFADHRT